MRRTISYSRGKGKLRHTNRKFLPSNVDVNRIADNIIIKQENLKDAYDKLFGRQLKVYNEKQKRDDRKIKDYFEKLFGTDNEDTIVKNSNKQQSFYEYVVGVGGKENTALVNKTLNDGTEVKANPKAARIAAICLKEYILGNAEIGVKSFAQRNPNFYIFNAVIHMDELTPHLHYDFIPFSDGFKKGMSRQQGINKALEAMGYGKGAQAIYNFTQTERLVFQKICEAHGFEIEPQKKGRGFTIPTRLMETYYPIIQANERKIAEQDKQIAERAAALAELPKKPTPPTDFPYQTKEQWVEGYDYTDKYGNALEGRALRKAKKEMAKSSSYEENFKCWIEYYRQLDEWNALYGSAEKLTPIARDLKEITEDVQALKSEYEAKLADFNKREQHFAYELRKGIEEGIAADRRTTELAERRTADMRARADIAPAYKEKYSRIFAKTQNKERNDQNDSKLAETKPHRYYPAAEK